MKSILGKIFKQRLFLSPPKWEEDRPYEGDILGRLVYCLRPIEGELPVWGGNLKGRLLRERTQRALVEEAKRMAEEHVIRKPEDLFVNVRVEPGIIYVEARDNFTGGHATRCWMRDKSNGLGD